MAQPIFISYRRHDSSFFAAQLKDRLEQAFPGDVFLDVSGIEVGADLVQTLRAAVQSAKVVLVVAAGSASPLISSPKRWPPPCVPA